MIYCKEREKKRIRKNIRDLGKTESKNRKVRIKREEMSPKREEKYHFAIGLL